MTVKDVMAEDIRLTDQEKKLVSENIKGLYSHTFSIRHLEYARQCLQAEINLRYGDK